MSKFQELCHVYSIARRNYFDYWNECADFVSDLMSDLRQYFQMPRENLRFVPLKDKPEFGKRYAAKECMHLEQDTFWYVGVMMTLCGELEEQPEETLILPILVKKLEDAFTVKFGPAGDEFKIEEGNENSKQAFFDFLFSQVHGNYKDRLNKFLEKMISERRIGFVTE